jgi:fructose-1,6-bisphosphatase-3
MKNIDFLKIQSKFFPTVNDACKEIINLSSILSLPKGTEHFLSDIHGEYEAFSHIIKNASGTIKNKIEELFGTSIMNVEKKSLATLIYYPQEMIRKNREISKNRDLSDWYKINLYRLVELCRALSSGYTRSKVRKALPKDFSYILEELLNERYIDKNRESYFDGIIKTIIELDKAEEFIITLSKLIQQFAIDRLHIIGDIFDRGKSAEKILDMLLDYHNVDIQWGNHDILWMAAAAGSEVCMANALRISLRYGNLHTLEEGYGINLLHLGAFAMETYKDDPCISFYPKLSSTEEYSDKTIRFIAQMHKAISIIQFKIEGQLIDKYKEFELEERKLLDKIDFDKGTIEILGKRYKLNDTNFPTVNPKMPYKLTEEEEILVSKLKFSFMNNDKLQEHTRFLFLKGSMYLKFNGNLLYHGCIPTEENGEFSEFNINGIAYKGKRLIEVLEEYIRDGFFRKEGTKEKEYGKAIMWYLWNGSKSPLFGKDQMKTFERYFIDNEEIHKENRNYYYTYRDKEEYLRKIFVEFEMDIENSHIINGHVPVKAIKGEKPVKANGKLFVIDGGLSRAYQKTTGIAGYTLIYNSKGIILVAHEPFHSTKKAIEEEKDIVSTKIIIEKTEKQLLISDTDTGKEIMEQIKILKHLVEAYKKGWIKEKN